MNPMERGRDIGQMWPGDLLHEFFGVFFGIWASFVLTAGKFSLFYGAVVLALTAWAVFRLFNSPEGEKLPVDVRWRRYYLPTLGGIVITILAIYGFPGVCLQLVGVQLEPPPVQETLFLFVIVLFWILAVEFREIRRERREAQTWEVQ
jgi:uncharacterized membrane protein YfcA